MPNIGDQVAAGAPAPAAGTYQCSAPGCTSSFVASLAGAPLPSAHHAGASWRLTAMPGTHAASFKPAIPGAAVPTATTVPPPRARSSQKKRPAAGAEGGASTSV